MRYAIAIFVVGTALACAVFVHQRTVYAGQGPSTSDMPFGDAVYVHPSWEDPVAVLIGAGGIAAGVAVVAAGGRRRRKPADLIT